MAVFGHKKFVKDQVPNLKPVNINFGRGAAGALIARRTPKIIRPAGRFNLAFRDPQSPPNFKRLVIARHFGVARKNCHVSPILSNANDLGYKLPSPSNRLFFKIITK